MTPPLITISGFIAEKGRFPQHEVRKLTFFDRAHVIRDAVCDGGVDRVFGNVSSSL